VLASLANRWSAKPHKKFLVSWLKKSAPLVQISYFGITDSSGAYEPTVIGVLSHSRFRDTQQERGCFHDHYLQGGQELKQEYLLVSLTRLSRAVHIVRSDINFHLHIIRYHQVSLVISVCLKAGYPKSKRFIIHHQFLHCNFIRLDMSFLNKARSYCWWNIPHENPWNVTIKGLVSYSHLLVKCN